MEVITFDKLYINTSFDIVSVQEFYFAQIPGKHAVAVIKCQTIRKSLEDYIKKEKFGKIEVCAAGLDIPVFAGIMERLEVNYDGEYGIVKIKAVSGSYLLDQEKSFRSFQKKQGYKDLMNSVLNDKGKAIYILDDRIVEEPPVQYGETDWQFLNRLASRLHTLITPDINSVHLPRLYIGLRNGKPQGEIVTDNYIVRQNHFDFSGRRERSYEFETYEHYKIGDQVNFNGETLRICGKYGEIKNGILVFRYIFASRNYYKTIPFNNPRLHGKEITGRVVETAGERVKICLETDIYSESEIYYYYRWIPETGNLLYCMPEIGTYVTLYFCSDDENSGICINCIRKATEKIKKNWNADNKYFITPWEKVLYLKQDKMKIGSNDADIRIYGNQGIEFNSNDKIEMKAKQNIELHAAEILAAAPKEINIIRKNILQPAMINMHNDFDSKGKIGRVEEKLHFDDKEIPDIVLIVSSKL